jgi:molybdate transport system substrate-binding protein
MFRVWTLFFLLVALPVQAGERLLVFAAASQKDALEAIAMRYEETCDCKIVFSFAATSTLARQVEAGAPADIFISANQAWIDWLEIKGKLPANQSVMIAGNRLVIASAAKTKDSFNILMRDRFAMADPQSVPAGIYAREALQTMALWQRVKSNAVFAENVRVALKQIERGDLLSGITYQSDLIGQNKLHAHYIFPGDVHTPIRYLAGVVKQGEIARGFVDYLASEKAQDIFTEFGFLSLSVVKIQ